MSSKNIVRGILVLVLALSVTSVQARSRRSSRRDNYRIMPRASYSRRSYSRRRDPISKDLRRVSYGVGIASDILGLYQDVRYAHKAPRVVEQVVVQQPVVTPQPVVVYEQPAPVIIERNPPIIIRRSGDYRILPREARQPIVVRGSYYECR